MVNLLVPRSIKKEMKGTRTVQNQKKNQKGIQILTLRSRLGSHLPCHHRIRLRWISGRAPTTTACRQFYGHWVASDPPKGAIVDRIDSDALPLGSEYADERIHSSTAALARRARRARSTESPPRADPPLWCHHQICCPRTPGRNFRGHRRMTARRWSAHSQVSARAGEGPRGRRRRRSRLRPLHSGARSVSAGGKANGLRVCAGAR
jgi:hypothetical protein